MLISVRRNLSPVDLKIDDLLEKQKDGVALLDLEYVSLNVGRVLTLLQK